MSILSNENSKLSRRIFSFSLRAGETCPGKTHLCSDLCYAKKNTFLYTSVLVKYDNNFRISTEDNFCEVIGKEIRRRKIKRVRIHSSGDFYSPEYVEKWTQIADQFPDVRFYTYTRSWRVKEIRNALTKLSSRENVRLWYSCDKESGIPRSIPKSVRLAWLQNDLEEKIPSQVNLVFRNFQLRKVNQTRIGLALVCPTENGTKWEGDCFTCRFCWK